MILLADIIPSGTDFFILLIVLIIIAWWIKEKSPDF